VSDSCGYTDYLNKYLAFPPPGIFPSQLPDVDTEGNHLNGCDVFDTIYNEVFYVNPCWDIYQVATRCPLLWYILDFPGSFGHLPEGTSVYTNRTDVQKAINAPIGNWEECTSTDVFANNTDNSRPSEVSVLPGVIERSKRTAIGYGVSRLHRIVIGISTDLWKALDLVLISSGTLLMIQNMTWDGAQGFTSRPSNPFYVPCHNKPSQSILAASDALGTTHTERGLTWVSVDLSGHSEFRPHDRFRICSC
jgi:carboxypeptidase D